MSEKPEQEAMAAPQQITDPVAGIYTYIHTHTLTYIHTHIHTYIHTYLNPFTMIC